jgi:hypothetical protein
MTKEEMLAYQQRVQTWWENLENDLRFNIFEFFSHYERGLYCTHSWEPHPGSSVYLSCPKCQLTKRKIMYHPTPIAAQPDSGPVPETSSASQTT